MQLPTLELAGLHHHLLYDRDQEGRILRRRTKEPRPTPRWHLTRTVQGNRWLVAAALPEDECIQIETLLSREPMIGSNDEMERQAPQVVKTEVTHRGPAFYFPYSLPTGDGADVIDDPADVATIAELDWIRDLGDEQRPVTVARNASGLVVAACHSSRWSDSGAEAGVETADAFRGQGLAVAVVTAWAAAVRADGRTPLYSTEWSNSASRAVARKLGLVMYGEDTAGAVL